MRNKSLAAATILIWLAVFYFAFFVK